MLERLLITGANGSLGSICRQRLGHLAKTVRVSARRDLGEAGPNEELVFCDLDDKAAVEAMVEGCDGIIHMGGKAVEGSWETVKAANIEGMFNLYEGARKSSVRPRILFASSHHVTGFHRQTARLNAETSPVRPDGLYAVSKVFGEALARMYFDKFGIETASVRIGSCFPEPSSHRMMSSWLSADDMVALAERIFNVPRLGCPVLYGVSDNASTWWDNSTAGYLGWSPKDSSEQFRSKLDAEQTPPKHDEADAIYQGGLFCTDVIHED
ncbi:NAD-dependent epimerase/dehydratase family protein [Leisingera thetidis]|uniref:NAD-dependent epimerase/dehydratase family protein n=1 Tax=Leisingera thetidis TaxID=2930199 RepID=UPI0021F77860|nr:NAD(P)-dependent oxidoreductase [Leisingera thetidis]